MIYDSFKDWVEQVVHPLQKKNPNWHRLDGQTSGGNRNDVGKFRYRDRVWIVHADTRFAPVIRAYQSITNGTVPDPFTIQRAKVRDCLDLLPKLKIPNQPKHLYIYEI